MEVAVGAASSVVAVLVAALSYLQAKKLKFFESYFQKKADAFEKYIKAISFIPKTEEELYLLSSISRTSTLYCFEDTRKEIEKLLDLMIEAYQSRSGNEIPESIQANFRNLRSSVISSLRNEIQVSRKFKF